MQYQPLEEYFECPVCIESRPSIEKRYLHCCKNNPICQECFDYYELCLYCHQTIPKEIGKYTGEERCFKVRAIYLKICHRYLKLPSDLIIFSVVIGIFLAIITNIILKNQSKGCTFWEAFFIGFFMTFGFLIYPAIFIGFFYVTFGLYRSYQKRGQELI